MKIVNYTSTPIILHGVSYPEKEFFLPENYNSINIRHNGQYLGGGDYTPYTNLYITQKASGEYVYHFHDLQIPDVGFTLIPLISAIGFCFIIKIIQKLKTS